VGVDGENAVRMAERLLVSFDGLDGLVRASAAELSQSRGIGQAKAVQLKAAFELGRRIGALLPEDRPQIRSSEDAAHILMGDMGYLRQEHLRVLLLDTRNRIEHIQTVYIGSLNASAIRVGEVFREAIVRNSAAIILAHNHPSGDPSPSQEDIDVTRQAVQAGRLLDIEVIDHLIVGHQCYVSLRDQGLGFG
jgi:DNA repair protein RadC